jgi:hypothetical protein
MNKESVLEILEQFQEAAMHIAEAEIQIRELNKIIEEQKEMLENFKRDILVWTVEDYDPNSDPEEVPPVTDLESVVESVVEKTPGWALAKRMGKKVKQVNRFTGEEKEFPTKTKCCEFLGISAISLQRDIDRDGKHGEWSILVDSPTA